MTLSLRASRVIWKLWNSRSCNIMVSVSTIGITVKLKKNVLHSDNFSRTDSVSGEPNSNKLVYQSHLE
jgi:hypothetical protein